jgi:uncharacterized membrane protein YjjP (DUF1212 family)
MKNEKQLQTIRLLRKSALIVLSVIGILLLAFSLFSGSEAYGGGLAGIVKNSPNSLPWIVLVMAIFIAWRRDIWGGFLITIFGGVITYFFNFTGGNFFLITFVVCLLIVFLGLVVLFSGLALKNLAAHNKV